MEGAAIIELTAQINSKAGEVRDLKAAKASKEVVVAAVAQLLALKKQFQEVTGQLFDAPKPPVAVTPAVAVKVTPQPQQQESEGPSKKELNKLAKKEKREAYKEVKPSAGEAAAGSAETQAVVAVEAVVIGSGAPQLDLDLELVYYEESSVRLCVAAAALAGVTLRSRQSGEKAAHLPYLVRATATASASGGSISRDTNIARYILATSPSNSTSTLLCTVSDPWEAAQVDQWLDLYLLHTNTSTGSSGSSPAEQQLSLTLSSTVALINTHLSDKTYLVGQRLTLADVAMTLRLTAAYKPDKTAAPHVFRWLKLVSAALATIGSSSSSGGGVDSGSNKGGVGVNSGSNTKKSPATQTSAVVAAADEGGACPALEGAVEGAVVTRFPPEPSGYLHIGHVKAVLLNQYYAQRYKGKLLVRFDDTNPSKEKEEFADNIMADLRTLGVVPSSVSHTSDHFETCERLAREMILAGNAYMDDTDQETMQAERMSHTESKHRNDSPEVCLAMFEQLLKGDPIAQSYCLRAKIDLSSVNGTMRDPVLYRFNATPHHRTGTKYRAYPTYDFACPIVDSVEGVTHALRTTEYNDRDEQYHWIQRTLKLRTTNIYSFGKMNFVHTVLSKRKLAWFVEQGLVDGWFDPRFPTVQGCVRRGMNVEVLKNFILNQGASKRVITMEWDKFWSENKRYLEDVAHRYMAVASPTTVSTSSPTSGPPVTVTVTNFAALYGEQCREAAATVALHPQRPALGSRVMRRADTLYLEQEDCAGLKPGEEVTLLRWGNFVIEDLTRSAEGVVTHIRARHDPLATNFSKTKKLTWLAATPDAVSLELVEFDHLISKAKLGEDEDFKAFVTPVTRATTYALGDACLRTVVAGQVIQLERRGFYRCDVAYTPPSSAASNNSNGGGEKPMVLFYIPDGKLTKPTATTTAVNTKKK